jgi:hypothetical protein
MKKLSKTFLSSVFALFLLLGFTNCKNETASEPTDPHMALEKAEMQLGENLKMYETVWDDILNKGDIDKINQTNFDENVTLITVPENIAGIQGFKTYYQNYLTGFSDITFTIVNVFGQGNDIVKHWNFKGIHSGEFFGIPASGRQVDIDGVTMVKMKDGKISQEEDFMDNLTFYQQLGIIPAE